MIGDYIKACLAWMSRSGWPLGGVERISTLAWKLKVITFAVEDHRGRAIAEVGVFGVVGLWRRLEVGGCVVTAWGIDAKMPGSEEAIVGHDTFRGDQTEA